MDQPAQLCKLTHNVFSALGDISFRRSETDGAPVMAVAMGQGEAAVPIRSLQREFQIDDNTEDGRMLSLVGLSLEFVTVLRPGDRLPAEVLGVGASWEPSARCREVARTRLERQLVAWFAQNGGNMNVLADDAHVQLHLEAALVHAALTLEADGPEQVVDLIERLASELAYIEALRESLLRRVEVMASKVAKFSVSGSPRLAKQETFGQVQRLSTRSRDQLRAKFSELDAQTSNIMTSLRNAESLLSYIRSSRDWLYRSMRAWSPLLDEWARTGTTLDDFGRLLLARTYRFLAPRYMSVTEWQSASRHVGITPEAMTW